MKRARIGTLAWLAVVTTAPAASGQGLPDEMDAMIWHLTPHPHDPNAVFGGVGAIDRGDPLAATVRTAPGVSDGPGEVILSRDRGESWERLDLTLPADRVLWAAAD